MERKKIVANVLVIDASVVIKWFVEEEYSYEARLLKNAYANGIVDIAVPSIMKYEVLNALKYSGGFGEDELKEIAIVLDRFQFTIYDIEGEYSFRTIEIAMRKGITIYDAAYVALAQILNTVMYTADKRLIRKIGDPNIAKHIREFKINL